MASKKGRMNVLIIGKQGSGKSSFINSSCFALRDKRDNFDCLTNRDFTNRTTTTFEGVNIFGNLYLFDTPGINYDTPIQKELLALCELYALILNGIKEGQTLPYGTDNEINNYIKSNKIIIDNSNQIDFVLWIASAADLQGKVTNLSLWKWIDLIDTSYYLSLFQFIEQKLKKNRLLPLLIYTHKDKTELTPKQLKEEAFDFLPPSQKFLLQNYTKLNESNKDTEYEVLSILHICVDDAHFRT